MKPFLPALACLLVLFLAIAPVQAENPTVIVADYTISPSVLQPGRHRYHHSGYQEYRHDSKYQGKYPVWREF